MNSSSCAVAFGHAEQKALPKRRFRRRVDICRPVPGARARRRPSAHPRSARGLQRAQVGCAHWISLALHATRLAAVGGRLPADAAVALGRRLRGDGPRLARTIAPFGGQGLRAKRGHTRLSHPALHSREWGAWRLRRGEAKERLEGTRGGGHFGAPARLARNAGRRAGAISGGRVGGGGARSDRRVGGGWRTWTRATAGNVRPKKRRLMA